MEGALLEIRAEKSEAGGSNLALGWFEMKTKA